MKIVTTEGENLHIGFRNFSEIFRKGVAYENIFRKTTAGNGGFKLTLVSLFRVKEGNLCNYVNHWGFPSF